MRSTSWIGQRPGSKASPVSRGLAFALAYLLSAAPVRAAETPQGLVDLAERYVEAIRSSDAEALEELQMPLLERCRTSENAEDYAALARDEVRAVIGTDPHLTIERVDGDDVLEALRVVSGLSGQEVRLPTTPTHVFELTQRTEFPEAHVCSSPAQRVRRFAVQTDGRWMIVPQCLPGGMFAALADGRARRRAVERLQGDLYSELDPALRDELLGLIRERRLETAVARYSERTGASRGSSIRLAERLCRDIAPGD